MGQFSLIEENDRIIKNVIEILLNSKLVYGWFRHVCSFREKWIHRAMSARYMQLFLAAGT